jgi:hypothetical protein
MVEQPQKLHEIIEQFLDSIPKKELQNPEKTSKTSFKAKF